MTAQINLKLSDADMERLSDIAERLETTPTSIARGLVLELLGSSPDDGLTYCVVRQYMDSGKRKTMKRGLTLSQARAYLEGGGYGASIANGHWYDMAVREQPQRKVKR